MAISKLFKYSQQNGNSPKWLEENKFAEVIKYSNLTTILMVSSIDTDLQFIAYGSNLNGVSQQTREDIIQLHLKHPDSIVSPFSVSIDETQKVLVLKYLSTKHHHFEDDKKIYVGLREIILTYLSYVMDSAVVPDFNYSLEDIK